MLVPVITLVCVEGGYAEAAMAEVKEGARAGPLARYRFGLTKAGATGLLRLWESADPPPDKAAPGDGDWPPVGTLRASAAAAFSDGAILPPPGVEMVIGSPLERPALAVLGLLPAGTGEKPLLVLGAPGDASVPLTAVSVEVVCKLYQAACRAGLI